MRGLYCTLHFVESGERERERKWREREEMRYKQGTCVFAPQAIAAGGVTMNKWGELAIVTSITEATVAVLHNDVITKHNVHKLAWLHYKFVTRVATAT